MGFHSPPAAGWRRHGRRGGGRAGAAAAYRRPPFELVAARFCLICLNAGRQYLILPGLSSLSPAGQDVHCRRSARPTWRSRSAYGAQYSERRRISLRSAALIQSPSACNKMDSSRPPPPPPPRLHFTFKSSHDLHGSAAQAGRCWRGCSNGGAASTLSLGCPSPLMEMSSARRPPPAGRFEFRAVGRCAVAIFTPPLEPRTTDMRSAGCPARAGAARIISRFCIYGHPFSRRLLQ